MKYLKTPENVLELIQELKNNGVPTNEYQSYVNSFLEMKARRDGIPLHGYFELTPLCNLDCKMCYVHLNNHQFSPSQLMPIDAWTSLIDQAHELGMLRASLTGGESLTYPCFDELYLHLYNKGIRTRIFTNGLLLDDHRIQFFKRYRPSIIQISVYGSSEEEYEAVTGHKVYEQVYANIMRLKETELPVSISITPNAFMKQNFRHLLETVEALGVPYHINSALMTPRKNTGRVKADLSDEQYIELYRIQGELKHFDLSPIELSELPDANTYNGQDKALGLRCGAGRSSFTIQWDGSMSPCSGLNEEITHPLQIGFKEAWKELNDIAINYMVPIECQECFYHNKCLTCAAMHKDAPKGHCDTAICEHTKKLLSAGILRMPQL